MTPLIIPNDSRTGGGVVLGMEGISGALTVLKFFHFGDL